MQDFLVQGLGILSVDNVQNPLTNEAANREVVAFVTGYPIIILEFFGVVDLHDGEMQLFGDTDSHYEKKQLVHRQPAGFVRRVLNDFNAGALDAATAASHLGVSRSRLYQLRTDFEGRNYDISTTLRKSVTIVYHPNRQFWVVEHPPMNVWPSILGHFTL